MSLLDEIKNGAAEMNAAIVAASREKRIQFYKLSELRAYQPDDNSDAS